MAIIILYLVLGWVVLDMALTFLIMALSFLLRLPFTISSLGLAFHRHYREHRRAEKWKADYLRRMEADLAFMRRCELSSESYAVPDTLPYLGNRYFH